MQVSRKTYIVFMKICIAKFLKNKYIQQNAKKKRTKRSHNIHTVIVFSTKYLLLSVASDLINVPRSLFIYGCKVWRKKVISC